MWVAGLEEAPDTCFANHHLPRSPEEFGEYSSPKPLTSSQRLQAELLIRVHLQLQKASAAEGRIPAPLPLFVIECLYLCSMREGAATPRINLCGTCVWKFISTQRWFRGLGLSPES